MLHHHETMPQHISILIINLFPTEPVLLLVYMDKLFCGPFGMHFMFLFRAQLAPFEISTQVTIITPIFAEVIPQTYLVLDN